MQHPAACTAPSDIDADQLTYTFYALAFVSLARPTTLMDIKFEDVTYPDMKLVENAEFFNWYVEPASFCLLLQTSAVNARRVCIAACASQRRPYDVL